MINMPRKSDFILKPYMESSNARATYQILNTLIPYFVLWYLLYRVSKVSLLMMPPIVLLIVLFSLRSFSLMHDCGHNSLFASKKANRVFGFLLGLINAIPQYWWSRDHAFHHKTNGNWELYRGIGDFLSTEEYACLTPFKQRLYRILRHPLMIFPGGFFYLAFKPRLILLAGTYDFVRHCIVCKKANYFISILEVVGSHRSKQWGSAAEFWDVLFNNIFVVGLWVFLSRLLGVRFFLGSYSIVLMLSAAIFICLFFIQHNFEGSYANKTEGWDYLSGAIEGSSYIQMPAILKWFTADISYHSIHHLSERIPNYNLKACHQRNCHLLTKAKILRCAEILHCSKFILWSSASNQLVSIDSYPLA